MLLGFRPVTGTNLAIALVNVAFLTGAGVACWRGWAADQMISVTASHSRPESLRGPQLLTATVSMPTDELESETLALRSPSGTWRRISEPAKITLQFGRQHLSGLYQTDLDGDHLVVSFGGDYRIGDNNLLYGVIQEAGVRSGANSPHDASRLIDQPFSVRYELSATGLQIKDVKFAGSGLRLLDTPVEKAFAHFVGGYARVADRG